MVLDGRNLKKGLMPLKFDMHCHTAEGSIDARISIKDYAQILKDKGFGGMLVADHDSYRGYEHWRENRDSMPDDFIVLKGIEYDTRNAGHFIVILPDGVHLPLLQYRGLRVEVLTKVVHEYGGVVGVAHPFGMKSSSAMFCWHIRKHPEILSDLDFVEGLNACEKPSSNVKARELADKFDLPCTGGTDAHVAKYVGLAYTDFSDDISCCDDMIDAIRNGGIAAFGGRERTYKPSHEKRNFFAATWGFKAYNQSLGLLYKPYRRSVVHRILGDYHI